MNPRIGFGYDIHRLVSGEDLVLGGAKIDYPRGLKGHSDADVLCHAIIDSLLGAANLDDMGTHFPDSNEDFKDVSSILLLKKTHSLLSGEELCIGNIDSTIILEKPHLNRIIPRMKENISVALDISDHNVNIKATTNEKIGDIGNGDAIAAYAVCILRCD